MPYKLCIDCRNRNAGQYQKHGAKVRTRQKKPENRARERELKKTPERTKTRVAARALWAATPEGREVLQRLERKRGDEINASVGLRVERSLTASIRLRLSGQRHGESVNLENYTEFSSDEDVIAHFKLEMKSKPGMTMDNYGTFWSVAHKIPKAYYDFSDPDELRRCNSKANLGCDYEKKLNPLMERTNGSKGAAMPSLAELYAVGTPSWPKAFGTEMNEEKRRSIPLEMLKRQRL